MNVVFADLLSLCCLNVKNSKTIPPVSTRKFYVIYVVSWEDALVRNVQKQILFQEKFSLIWKGSVIIISCDIAFQSTFIEHVYQKFFGKEISPQELDAETTVMNEDNEIILTPGAVQVDLDKILIAGLL